MIAVESLSKSFDGIPLLEDVSFRVESGERASLIGPGGCGKSTILKILLGLMPPDTGDVTLLGQEMGGASEAAKRATLRHVGMAFQQGALFDYMSVRDNLIFAMAHMTDYSRAQMDKVVKTLLDAVKLGRTERMYPYELSGGMQRRVGIARALATNPQVAIFDEPTSGLDPVTSTIILNMINDLGAQERSTTLLVATSSVEIAIRFADRLIVVNDGQVAADGPWRELLLDGPDWVRHFLGVRLIGLDLEYARGLDLPEAFIRRHWS